ncbi:hypothetical protein M8C21_018653 [Ambrosia artemisiifolia]|uniref:Uncharacterized protein n=1 Tax=Ambrosia artemisiifolia TaxID=4212 RepID=A0AAD5BT97_AMBAR|nr:hypothetical protein M8C21_018653 [Ambrosia artemisiifolia]
MWDIACLVEEAQSKEAPVQLLADIEEVPCYQDVVCERKCQRVRDCGRHACKRKCCDCPPCSEICDEKLRCKNLKCPSPCHSKLNMHNKSLLSTVGDHALQELAAQLTELWNLMDTSEEERSLFNHVTCNISVSVYEVIVPGSHALNLIEQAEVEVERLDKLKASKMKDIDLKKQEELEEIFAQVHIQNDKKATREKILALIVNCYLTWMHMLSKQKKKPSVEKIYYIKLKSGCQLVKNRRRELPRGLQ